MRSQLTVLFLAMLIIMLSVTIWASLNRGIFDAGQELVGHPWFIATLVDAYFAFTVFFVWLAWRERSLVSTAAWFVLVMCLGSIAIAGRSPFLVLRGSRRATHTTI